MAATGLLLRPSLPHSIYFGQWTPNLGHLEWYRGRVLEARLGALALGEGRLSDLASDEVRALLLARAPLEVRAVAGPPTSRLGSLVSVYDEQQREIVLLGPSRNDLLLRLRTRSVTLGLENPPLRWRGALDGVRVGDTVTVDVRAGASGACLGVNGRDACGVAHSLGEGWALLASESLAGFPERVLDVVWLAVLVLPVGLWLRWGASGVCALAVSGAGALVSARLLGSSSPAWWEIGALLAGLAGGAVLRLLAQRTEGDARRASASVSTQRSIRA